MLRLMMMLLVCTVGARARAAAAGGARAGGGENDWVVLDGDGSLDGSWEDWSWLYSAKTPRQVQKNGNGSDYEEKYEYCVDVEKYGAVSFVSLKEEVDAGDGVVMKMRVRSRGDSVGSDAVARVQVRLESSGSGSGSGSSTTNTTTTPTTMGTTPRRANSTVFHEESLALTLG